MYGQNGSQEALVAAAVGASCMGVWSAVSTTASTTLQGERRQGTLELLVASPAPFPLAVVPATIAMGTIGLWSLVATLLWGRLAFGIPINFDQPLVFVVAGRRAGLLPRPGRVPPGRRVGALPLGVGARHALEFPVWLICGFLVPLALLPDWVAPIAWVLPPTWGVAAVRDAALGRQRVARHRALPAPSGGVRRVGMVLADRLVDSARARRDAGADVRATHETRCASSSSAA